MVWIPGGEFWMGSDEPQFPDARPWHRVYVDGFWMDKTEVTNEQFEKFVKATGYVTIAERKPTKEQFPTAPEENLVAGSVVFTPPNQAVPLDNHLRWWDYVRGDEFKPGGRWMANTFQGHFPDKNTGEDGFAGTAPVGSFPPNGYGLYDIAGNVWEWCSDWYRPDYYQTLADAGGIARNPPGPDDSLDPSEPGTKKRVHKGGSYLCTDQYCKRYMPGGRGKGEPDTGTNHLGFRTVMTRAMWEARQKEKLGPSH